MDRHPSRMLYVAALVVSLLAPSPLLARCGVERWDVKTGTDADAAQVDLSSSTSTTIAALIALDRPDPYPPANRAAPAETTQWVVEATLKEFKFENSSTTGDSDYHLVLVDADGNAMVAEIPSPDCVGDGSPFATGIAHARSEFDARFTATGNFQTANVPVRVTGVGMFDFAHGQRGAAPNVIEIHPVLDIAFMDGGAGAPALSATPPGEAKVANAPSPHAHTAGATVNTTGFKPGVERWAIKTSLAPDASPESATSVDLADLIDEQKLPPAPGVKKDDARFQDARIPSFDNALQVADGTIVSTTGWLHLVAAEADGDYHIQISTQQSDGDNCLIVEVPMPDQAFVADAALRPRFAPVRQLVKQRMLQGHEPSSKGSVMMHPPCVKVTGQLFYDDAHVNEQPRGKKGMKAATLWELHPVTDLQFSASCP